MTGDLAAVGGGAGDGSGPERGGVGGIGLDRRNAGQQQCRERKKAAAAENGVQHAGNESREKEDESVVQVHAGEFLVSSYQFQEESKQARKYWCERGDSNLSRLAGVSEVQPSGSPQAKSRAPARDLFC